MKLVPKAKLNQSLKLRQTLSPKMIQTLNIFNLSYEKFNQKVQTEVDNNSAIEIIRFEQLRNNFSKGDNANDFTDYTAKPVQTSLKDHLLNQLSLSYLSETENEIATYLIDYIDKRGYIENYDLVRENISLKFNVSKRKINDILGIIQDFEPDGVGARSLKECLLIQINHHNFENEKLREIFKLLVSKYLNQLADQEYEKIATACNIEIAGVEQLHQFIKQNLNPNPGASFTSESSSHVVIPSFEVELDHYGQLKLTNLEKDKGLEITISKKISRNA